MFYFQVWNREWKKSLPRVVGIWDVLEAFQVESENSEVRENEIRKRVEIYSSRSRKKLQAKQDQI